MSNTGRINNSIKNISNGIISQIISLVCSFVVRTIFIKCLNEEYLGVNGLFSNILTILSLAELGFSSAIVYSMYEPLSNNDTKKLQAIMNLYKKIYNIIGIIVGIIGISLIPFMDYIIKDKPNIDNLTLIYIVFLSNSVCSYFFAYKRSILTADQKEYISSMYRYIFVLIKSIVQILILVLFKNFILYLMVQVLFTVIENIFISNKVNSMYPFLNEYNKEVLTKSELLRIKKDVEALIIVKFGHVMLNGTDNIIISSFVGIKAVGLLSNYDMVVGSLAMLTSQIISNLAGSIGNYMAKEESNDKYNLFKKVDFFNFWLYGFSTICLAILLNPFIELWIGKDYLLNQNIVNIISINFLVNGMSTFLWMFRSTMGIFTQAKYRPIICAFLNIIISIFLSRYIGIIGVLLGTTISRLFSNLLIDPVILHKYGFNKSAKNYFTTYLFRSLLLVFTYILLYVIKLKIFVSKVTVFGFIILMIISIITINLILLLFFYKTNEFKYILNIIKPIIIKIKSKVALN